MLEQENFKGEWANTGQLLAAPALHPDWVRSPPWSLPGPVNRERPWGWGHCSCVVCSQEARLHKKTAKNGQSGGYNQVSFLIMIICFSTLFRRQLIAQSGKPHNDLKPTRHTSEDGRHLACQAPERGEGQKSSQACHFLANLSTW